MENGTFQPSLRDADFVASPSLPTRDFQSMQVQRSSSLQSLLQQNEDLSIRLKFSIQKLAEIENTNDQLATDNRKLNNTIQALQEQLLIWKEKERIWQERHNKSEQQMIDLKQSIPETLELQSELSRYHRYHEKVKTQIKPYIQQLKEYAKGLSEHIRELNVEIERKNFENQQLAGRNNSVETELASHLTTHAKILEDLKNYYETELANLKKENLHLTDRLLIAESKAERLDQAQERQDELLNQTIVLKRKTDDLRDNYVHETEGLRQSLHIARNEIIQKSAQIENLENKNQDLAAQLLNQNERIEQLQDQMAGLRIIWSEKSTELEKIQHSNQALEKLNTELSQKLRDSRQQEASV